MDRMAQPGRVGTRIRARRLDLGIKQVALAEAVGVSPAYLNLIEHNRRPVGGARLRAIADALGTEVFALAEGAEADLLAELHAACAAEPAAEAELAEAERFAARFPGWARLVAAQARRAAALERDVALLTDRMGHDPHLSEALHDVLSTVTAVRSTSAILAGPEEIAPEWQRRFHRNLYEDSQRLAEGARALVSYLEAEASAERTPTTPQEELEAWLDPRGHHVPELEGESPSAPEALAVAFSAPASRALAEAHFRRYRAAAERLPFAPLAEALGRIGPDPGALADRFGVPPGMMLWRLACLPEGTAGLPATGLVACDASGTPILRKPIAGFPMPRYGAGCPLWPLYRAISRPQQPVAGALVPAGGWPERFEAFAVCEPLGTPRFDAEPVLQAVMLVLPEHNGARAEQARPAEPVGAGCRVCPRAACPARREPSLTDGALA